MLVVVAAAEQQRQAQAVLVAAVLAQIPLVLQQLLGLQTQVAAVAAQEMPQITQVFKAAQVAVE